MLTARSNKRQQLLKKNSDKSSMGKTRKMPTLLEATSFMQGSEPPRTGCKAFDFLQIFNSLYLIEINV